MDEYAIRELCEAFFDAYENRRIDVLERLYADDCIVWHNVFGRDTTGAENVAALPDGYRGQRRRTYNDRIVNTFEDGFVIQYSLNGVQHNGHRGALWICIVGRCRDGKITRIDEYMDSSKFASWGRGSGGAAGGPEHEEGLADARAVRSVLRRDRAERLRDARVVLCARGDRVAQPRLPVSVARRQSRDAEAGDADASEGAVQGSPH